MLDVFNSNAFSVVEMTAAINKAPYVPTRIQELGLFQEEGITTVSAAIEELNGTLSLIPNQSRNGPVAQNTADKRKVRNFTATHLPLQDVITPESIQGVREFGTENNLKAVATVVNQKLISMRQKHEATLEFHRLGAIKGIILDSDGTTVLNNLFTVFGLTQTVIDFVLDNTATEVITKCAAVRREIDSKIGGTPYSGIHAFCSATFFDALTTHPTVKEAYKYQQSQFLREDNGAAGNMVRFGNITFEEMSRQYAGVTPIAANKAIAFPVGAPGLFLTRFAPGNMIEAANTLGKRFYARQEALKHGRGIELHTESNPLNVCTRPEVLIELTI